MRAHHRHWIRTLPLFLAGILAWQLERERPLTVAPDPTPAGSWLEGQLSPHPGETLPVANPAGLPSLLSALREGHPLKMKESSGRETTFLVRPAPLLAGGFGLTRGSTGQAMDTPVEVFSGWAFSGESTEPAAAHLALAGEMFSGVWRHPEGEETLFQGRLGSIEVTLSTRQPPAHVRRQPCTIEGLPACRQVQLGPVEDLETGLPTRPGQLTLPFPLSTAAQGGLEPATGQPTRYVDPFPSGTTYGLSLKEMDILLVLDKSASGPDEQTSLLQTASRWLATLANTASIYENQLGIRLRLQEMILIPDSSEFADVPHGNVLSDFNRWVAQNRPRAAHGWHSAFKVGSGLSSTELGLAYVASLGRSDSIGVVAPDTGWTTLTHEIGHSLGANHTRGGMMNSQANGGGERDFFTQVDGSPGVSAARQIFDHSRDLLNGQASLRHPEEIPFARNDFRVIARGETLRFDPAANDLHAVRFGKANAFLNVEEVTGVSPPGAGVLRNDGRILTFQPSAGFDGPAWFSYTLRGSLGNEGQGWLHKGDVTVQVGASPPPVNFTFSPGETRTLFIGEIPGVLTQPRHALVQTLPDDPGYLLIRVNADAEGMDTFMKGAREFRLTYRFATPRGRPDTYWHHPALGTLRMRPLANDEPTASAAPAGPARLSLGTDELNPLEAFPGPLRLVGAVNLSPDQGTLEPDFSVPLDPQAPFTELRFSPAPGASGVARLRYTADDPGGQRYSEDITIHLLGSSEILVPASATARYHIPQTPADASTWMLKSFSDRAWPTGALPIGYEHGRGYEAWIATDVGRQMVNVNSSLYVRIPFQIDEPAGITHLLWRMGSDDGHAVYLNGREVQRENVPTPLQWNSRAMEGREADPFALTDLSHVRSLLQRGQNLLAIQGLNAQVDSSDFLVMPELIALRLPRLASIHSPAAASVHVTAGTGIGFRLAAPANLETLPYLPPISISWQITEAPPGAELRSTRGEEGFDVAFDLPGTYRIRLTARDAAGVETVDQRLVHVGSAARPYDQLGPSVRAGSDLVLEGDTATLEAEVHPAIPGQSGPSRWEMVSGPGAVIFEDAGEPGSTTEARFPRSGYYHLRYVSEQPEFTVFDDLLVQVRPETRTLIGGDSRSRYRFFGAGAGALLSDWALPDHPDIDWKTGGQGLGYDLTGAFKAYIDTNIQQEMQFRHSSVYIRYEFVLGNVPSVNRLLLDLKADDGCVVYLNGREVHRQHAPFRDLGPASRATRAVDESRVEIPATVDLSEFIPQLRAGYNVLAIQGLNQAETSSDFLIQPSLMALMGRAGEDSIPAGLGGMDPLTFALGKRHGGDLSIAREGKSLALEFRQNQELENLGGRIDVEWSPDMRFWIRWPHTHEKRAPFNEEFDEVTRRGALPKEMGFFRLRVSF